jgi:High-affinity nickel-transport protein
MRLADRLLLSEKRAEGMAGELVPDDAAVLPTVTHTTTPPLGVFGANFGMLSRPASCSVAGLMNLVILGGIIKVFQAMRRGEYDEAELERQLENRGFFYRFFGRWMKAIDKEWQMYPVGSSSGSASIPPPRCCC